MICFFANKYMLNFTNYLTGVAPMVQDAKAVAMNINDSTAVSHWRESNRTVRILF